MKYVLNALLSASQPSLLIASFTYVLASPAHPYMPQLFTQCLPSVICVTLMSIVCTTKQVFYILFYVHYSPRLCASITLALKAIESCSKAQKTW